MIVFWSRSPTPKVIAAVNHATRDHPSLPVKVISSMEGIPNPAGMKVLLSMGTEPLAVLAEAKVVPKNRTMTSLRAQPLPLPNTPAKLLVTYSPGIGEVDYGHFVDLQCDAGSAVRLAVSGSITPKYGQYQYVSDFKKVREEIEYRFANELGPDGKAGNPVDVAMDLETIGLDPYLLPAKGHPGAYIVCIQVSTRPGHSDLVYFDSPAKERDTLRDLTFLSDLAWLLSSPKVKTRGSNLKFDLHWLFVRAGIECTNFVFDTTLVGSLLDENRSNGLDVHCKIYAPELGSYSDHFDRTVDKSRMDLVPKADMLLYAGGDTDATHRVATAQKSELLKDEALTKFYVHILHPAARAFEKLERTGVLVDQQAYAELRADLVTEVAGLLTDAKRILGGRIVAKHFDQSKAGGLNLSKASMINDFMFGPMGLNLKPKMTTEKTGAASTSLDHLLMFADVPEAAAFINLYKDYASATKTLSTFVDGFLSHLRSDGRFHSAYWFFAGNRDQGDGGTVTGRLSAHGPAFQCLRGDVLVTTDRGQIPIKTIVEASEQGEAFRVLTHTGKWQRVVGTYRNGVQPVFSVLFGSGVAVHSTGNHPYLTLRGWVRTDQLNSGDTCYAVKGYRDTTQDAGLHQPDLLQLGGYEEPLHQPYQQGLAELRGQGDHSNQRLAAVRELPSRHGGEALQGVEHREAGCEWELRARELRMGDPEDTAGKPQELKANNSQREDPDRGRVGNRGGDQQWASALQTDCGDAYGASLDEGDPWDRAIFQETAINCITYSGEFETFDLTVEGSHSFVANGIVVHNTIPKHTKYAKRIRRCFIAPPGYVMMERDYSQGELRVVACIANEQTMIKAYMQGLDLHCVTGAKLAGITYEQLMALEDTDPEKFSAIRQPAKPANFGLLYGQSAEGFRGFAESNYGVKMSPDRAEEICDAFFALYSNLPVYHKQYKAHAKKYGHVRSPLGRIRHLPLINSNNRMVASGAERQAINSVVQSTLSDMLLWSIAEEDRAGLSSIAPAIGAIHDAAYNYLPEDRVDELVQRHLEIMESLPFHRVGWKPQLKFLADAKIGKNMGDLSKWKAPK